MPPTNRTCSATPAIFACRSSFSNSGRADDRQAGPEPAFREPPQGVDQGVAALLRYKPAQKTRSQSLFSQAGSEWKVASS